MRLSHSNGTWGTDHVERDYWNFYTHPKSVLCYSKLSSLSEWLLPDVAGQRVVEVVAREDTPVGHSIGSDVAGPLMQARSTGVISVV